MTTENNAQQKSTASGKRKAPEPPEPPERSDAQEASARLTRKQALAMWELVIKGDGTVASNRSVKLSGPEVKGLESAGLITIQSGRQKARPSVGAKTYLTDAGWAWANRQGLAAKLAQTKITTSLLEMIFVKIGAYLTVHDLTLDHLLRPRRDEPEPSKRVAAASEERIDPASSEPLPAALEERIRAAYLRVTSGALNQRVRLALLRAELRDEAVDAVDAELRAMQQRGGVVLYPLDDPQQLRPEDDAAALRVSGERRDLLFIKG